MIEDLEILCLFFSYEGREANFFDISTGKDWMILGETKPADFWYFAGGFSITVNRYNTIFRAFNFYNLLEATTYLFKSVCWIKKEYSSCIDADDVDGKDLSIKFGYSEVLKMENRDLTDIALSYYKDDSQWRYQRGDRFFDNEVFNKRIWLDAVAIALDEYFFVMNDVIKGRPADDLIGRMSIFYNEWERIKAI